MSSTDTAHEVAAALLGVWVLDACSAEEAETVMAHLPRCEICTTEVVRLRNVVDLLGTATQPPAGLRGRTLERAMARRAAAAPCPDYAEPYAAQVSVLDSLLGELSGAEWTVNVIYSWSVQDVVAHLAATDGLVAARVGVDVDPPVPAGQSIGGDVLAERTAALIEREQGRTPAQTRAFWRTQADAMCRRLPADPARRTDGIPMRISDAVVTRAFETWVHTDDIARAVGRELPPPLPRHLHPIAGLGVRTLRKAFTLTWGDERPAAAAQVVLDGPGGGEWTIGLGGPGRPGADGRDPAVRLEMDVLEFCFLAGGRRDPATVTAEVTGDERLGRDLLTAAPAFAGP
jgi:uncharacterized protein (TIGR03083 family)